MTALSFRTMADIPSFFYCGIGNTTLEIYPDNCVQAFNSP